MTIREVPDVMKQAILAAEDERFYQHGGVDYVSVARAALANVASGSQQGAGTITMQVARNFFLTREKTVSRKLREALLAWKIEANLSKDEILELYVNQIFLGQRAYGFAAASQIYFGKPLKDIMIPEAAMLAGLPKAPSAYNPVTNPKRAKTRQLYVLRRMHELKFITDAEFKEAQGAPLSVRQGIRDSLPTHARKRWSRKWRARWCSTCLWRRGVHLAESPSGPRSARRSRRRPTPRCGVASSSTTGVTATGGPENYINLPVEQAEQEQALDRVFQETADSVDNLVPAVVLEASPTEVKTVLASGDVVLVNGRGPGSSSPRNLTDKSQAAQRVRRGAVVRLTRDEKGKWSIAQLPQAEAAFLAISPLDGAIIALTGGYDYEHNKFNHVTQALRQPGSSFKPFIYSAALEKGFSPATVINDAPFFVLGDKAGGEDLEPKNYDGKFDGPMRLARRARQVEAEPRHRPR